MSDLSLVSATLLDSDEYNLASARSQDSSNSSIHVFVVRHEKLTSMKGRYLNDALRFI